MKVLWVSAHPDPRSLTGALRRDGIDALRSGGHQVRESDLYAMRWNPVVDHEDFGHDPATRLEVLPESQRAYETGALREDIRAEQDKLRWSDTVVVQFPLWWFGTPAILKGWFDRVFVQGFAQGVLDPRTGRALRYGNGGLVGRRAMVVVTVGAKAETTGPRGIHGEIGDLLFPLQHGTLWYAGMAVVPPFVVHGTTRLAERDYPTLVEALARRLLALPETPPLPFRSQDGGDYDEHLVLRPDRAPGGTGLAVHSVTHPPRPGRIGSWTTSCT